MGYDSRTMTVSSFLAITALIIGAIIGSVHNEDRATRATVIECVTKPAVCKTRYDYYQLQGVNK